MSRWRATLGISVLASGLVLQGCEGDPGPPKICRAAPIAQIEGQVLRLLGTEAMVPLARNLGYAWNKTLSGAGWKIVVEPSGGSMGGVRAVRDGVIDLGMISRSLTVEEISQGLSSTVVARSGVVLATHAVSPRHEIHREEIRQLYTGGFIEDGFLLLRNREDSANTALEQWFPELRELREQAYLQRQARVIFHDDSMREALVAAPEGIGLVDLGAVLNGSGLLRGLTIDGIQPSLEALRDGRWKALRELSFVYRTERTQHVQAFLRFVTSGEAQSVIEQSGCVVPQGSR